MEQFVLDLASKGSALAELVADLIEELPTKAHPGEKPTALVVEMPCGTIRAALISAGPRDPRRATGLVDHAATRTAERQQLVRDVSRCSQGDGVGIGRTYV